MDRSDAESEDSDYQERLAKMQQFFNESQNKNNPGSLAQFEKVSQKNNVIESQEMFYFKKEEKDKRDGVEDEEAQSEEPKLQ